VWDYNQVFELVEKLFAVVRSYIHTIYYFKLTLKLLAHLIGMLEYLFSADENYSCFKFREAMTLDVIIIVDVNELVDY